MVWEHNQNEARKKKLLPVSVEDRVLVVFYKYSGQTGQREHLCMSQPFFSFSYFTDKESGRIITDAHPEIDHKIQIREYCYRVTLNTQPTPHGREYPQLGYYYIILFTTLTADLLGF